MDAKEFLQQFQKQKLAGQTRESFRYTNDEKKISCASCNLIPLDKSELDWHRIIPNREYSEENCLCVCKSCHKKIHKVINALRLECPEQEVDYHQAILLATLEP